MRSLDTEGTGVIGHRATTPACGGGVIPTDILSIGRATPSLRVTQEQSFQYSDYRGKTIRRLFLNTGIEFRHFYFENALRVDETSDELNRRYLHGAMETGCKAARTCLAAGGLSPRDVDLFVVCTSTALCLPGPRQPSDRPFGFAP